MDKKSILSSDECNFLSNIMLSETGLFNYNGGQSSVYNRFVDNNVTNLKELFVLINNDNFNFGADKMGDNYYIHYEIKGIIMLLQYKYLGIVQQDFNELMNFKINTCYPVAMSSFETGYPGKIFNSILKNKLINNDTKTYIFSLYKTLKSCGFDNSSTKALIDYAFAQKIMDISLGDYLLSIDLDDIKKYFKRIPQEYIPFLNVYNIIMEYYNFSKKEKQGFNYR